MTTINDTAFTVKWKDKLREEFLSFYKDKLREEFLCFYKELDIKINNYKEKKNSLIGVTHQGVEVETEVMDIVKLKNALRSLTNVYLDLSSGLTKLCDKIDFNKHLEQTDLDKIKKNLEGFQSELEAICETIKDNLFKTKSEKFLLKVKSILFKIVNFITDKGYARSIVTEHNILLLNGPGSYSVPIRTLPERPKNSLFFTRQIAQELNGIEKIARLSYI